MNEKDFEILLNEIKLIRFSNEDINRKLSRIKFMLFFIFLPFFIYFVYILYILIYFEFTNKRLPIFPLQYIL